MNVSLLKRPNPSSNGVPPVSCPGEEQCVAVALQECERNRQVVGVLVDLVPALLPFIGELVQLGMIGVINCMMIEAVMYGYTPSATIEKFFKPASGEEVQHTEQLIVLDVILQRACDRRQARGCWR